MIARVRYTKYNVEQIFEVVDPIDYNKDEAKKRCICTTDSAIGMCIMKGDGKLTPPSPWLSDIDVVTEILTR